MTKNLHTGLSEVDREAGLPEDILVEDRYFDELAENRVAEGEEEPLLTRTDNSEFNTRPWYRRPSPWWIIPGLFISAINYGMLIAPLQMFLVTCVCEDYFASQNTTISLIGMPYENCLIPEVASLVSKLQIIYDLCQAIPALFIIGFWGKLSDRKGRKLVMGTMAFSVMIQDLCLLSVALFRHRIGYKWLLLGPIVYGLSGGRQLSMATSAAYVSDCVPPSRRSVVFGRIMAAFFGGLAIGPALGGIVLKVTGNFTNLVYISFTIHTIWFLYVTFIIPESLIDKHREIAMNKRPQKFLDHVNIFAAVSVLYTIRTTHVSKYALPLLGALNFIITLSYGSVAVTFLYAGLEFKWTAYENGIWMSFSSAVRILVLLAVMPIIVLLFKKLNKSKEPRLETDNDSSVHADPHAESSERGGMNHKGIQRKDILFEVWVLRISYLLDIVAYIAFGLASAGWMFYVGSSIHSLSALANPSSRSLMTSIVPPSQIGEVLAAVAIVDSVAGIIGPAVLNFIYATTVSTVPNLVFFFVAGLMLCAMVLSFHIKPAPRVNDNLRQD